MTPDKVGTIVGIVFGLGFFAMWCAVLFKVDRLVNTGIENIEEGLSCIGTIIDQLAKQRVREKELRAEILFSTIQSTRKKTIKKKRVKKSAKKTVRRKK